MRKNVSNFLEVYSYNELASNTNQVSQILPASISTKLAEKERIEIKIKRFPRRKRFEN